MPAHEISVFPHTPEPLWRTNLTPDELDPLDLDGLTAWLDGSRPTKGRTNGAVGLLAHDFQEQVSAIWAGARIVEYLSATDARRQVWHAWLAASPTQLSDHNAMSGPLVYQHLTLTAGRTLLEQVYGRCPQGALNTLGKLGPEARPRDIYQGIIAVLGQEGSAAAKLLRHAPTIDNEVILALATLPPGLGSRALLAVFKAGTVPGHALGYLCWTLQRLEHLAGASVAQGVMESDTPLRALRDAVLALAFPAPPWGGTELIVPVTSAAMLRRIGQEFANCLTGAPVWRQTILRILSRERYLYWWRGGEPALLSFRPVGPVGLYIAEASGIRNAPVSPRTMTAIGEALRESGCLSPVPVTDWFLSEVLVDA